MSSLTLFFFKNIFVCSCSFDFLGLFYFIFIEERTQRTYYTLRYTILDYLIYVLLVLGIFLLSHSVAQDTWSLCVAQACS